MFCLLDTITPLVAHAMRPDEIQPRTPPVASGRLPQVGSRFQAKRQLRIPKADARRQ
jgi:hypothetical protein